MSLVLTNAGEKLEIVATVVLPFVVHYADYVGATPAFTPGVAGGDTINGTKDLLVAPGSGQRVVRTISVHNDSGGADTITIQLDDAGVNYTIVTVALPDNYALYYDEDGWKVLDDNGSLVTVVSAHTLLGPYHSDTATNAPSRGSIIVADSLPDWDELIHPGPSYHLQTDTNDTLWGIHLPMVNGAWVGISGDIRIKFDQTNGDIELRLGDALGSDEVQVIDSGDVVVFRIDSDGNVTVVDDAWIGIGAALERIVFDAAGDISVMGADFGVGLTTPTHRLSVEDDVSGGYAAKFFNDGDNVDRHGILIQGGDDIAAAVGTTYYLMATDGAGGPTGCLKTVNGLFQLGDLSDGRLKTNIKDTKLDGLDIINGLRVRDYNWKANPDGPVMTSFVAQEVQKVYPDMIGEEFDGTLMTSRAMLIPVLTKAIQELDARLTKGGM